MKGNLRVKRRDPWHRANAPSQAAADLVLSGEDALKSRPNPDAGLLEAGGPKTLGRSAFSFGRKTPVLFVEKR
jgi:hypothetical protein